MLLWIAVLLMEYVDLLLDKDNQLRPIGAQSVAVKCINCAHLSRRLGLP